MIVDCISDLHGHYPKLEGGDLLIVAGDLTARDTEHEHLQFLRWFKAQNYTKKVLIGGNHDNQLVGPWPGGLKGPFREDKIFYDFDYLFDSGTEFMGYRIYGSPWTKTFPGMNPHCKAFTVDTEEELAEKWALIPDDTDILITHSPPACIMDDVEHYEEWQIENVGSFQLIHYLTVIQPKLHVFGHIHEGYGEANEQNLQIIQNLFPNTIFVNASHVNERYQPVNAPIRIEL